jgi:hypothetical protein
MLPAIGRGVDGSNSRVFVCGRYRTDANMPVHFTEI